MCLTKSYNGRIVCLETYYDHSYQTEVSLIYTWRKRIHCRTCDEWISELEKNVLANKVCPNCGAIDSFIQRISKCHKFGFLKMKKTFIFNDEKTEEELFNTESLKRKINL